ncbi:MAG: GNAT family N-acetyltransferase [Candidatus Zixiibacteriota bacterium]|nr:MAG: GNAT family N-acetyltransferase [candidate division Zixibacteria bacterium]
MLTIEIVDDIAAFARLKPIWNDLLRQSRNYNIFISFEWLYSWWQVFGEGRRLYILLVRSDDEIVGIAPLMRSPGAKKTVIEFIGTPDNDYSDFILSGESENIVNKIISYLLERKWDWSVLNLSQIPDSSPTISILEGITDSWKNKCFIRQGDLCPTYIYEGSDEKRGEFSVKISRRHKPKINYFKKNGEPEIHYIGDPEKIERRLTDFYTFHINRWRGTNTPSNFTQKRYRDFYSGLIRELGSEKRIFLMEMIYNSRPVSFYLGFNFETVVYLYTPTYNVYYRKYSPGEIIHYYILEYFIRNGFNEVNLGRGGEPYKYRFSNKIRSNYRVTMYRSTLSFFMALLYNKLRGLYIINTLKKRWNIRRYLEALRRILRGGGLLNMIKGIFIRFLKMLYDYRGVFLFESYKIQEACENSGISLHKLESDRADEICSFLGYTIDSSDHNNILARLDMNRQCLAAKHHDSIIGLCWLSYDEMRLDEINRTIRLSDNEAFAYDLNISPVFNEQDIYFFLLARLAADLQPKNIKLLISCKSDDTVMISRLQQAGFKLNRALRYVRILGIKVYTRGRN